MIGGNSFESEKSSIDTDNIRNKKVLEKLQKLRYIINSMPIIPTDINDLKALEKYEPDSVFRLSQRPKAQNLQHLLNFEQGSRELGIICVGKQWLLIFGHTERVGLTGVWKEFQHKNLFQVDMHTHHGQEEYLDLPSQGDLSFLDTTIDGKLHIVSHKGITEFSAPHVNSKEIGGLNAQKTIEHQFAIYFEKVLGKTRADYDLLSNQEVWKVWRDFYEKHLKIKRYRWDEKYSIDNLMKTRENL